MKILAMVSTIFLAGISAWAGEAARAAGKNVTVCLEHAGGDLWFTKPKAQLLAARIFASAGVTIDWHNPDSCPMEGIRISFSTSTSQDLLPGALAYARPFEGFHIKVFYDRVRRDNEPDRLLAHVLVHEITHILQRTNRHSESGIMKERWTSKDIMTMRSSALLFTPLDLKLIQDGLAAREAWMAPSAGGGEGDAGGGVLRISSWRNDLAKRQSRATVSGDILRILAVSTTLNPPK
jgi:hypothetical protein